MHDLEELGDLERIVEDGPHWDTVVEIKINRIGHLESPTLTVEQALKL